jgi:cytochrome d ubiquinol oxidase subunit II
MDRWLERPYLFLLPILGLVSAVALAVGVRRRRNLAPGYAATATFVAAFTTFVVTFWPYMIPFSITFDQAAAPSASLSFMFWGEGLFVLPLMLGYTFINLRVFRGKRPVSSYHF